MAQWCAELYADTVRRRGTPDIVNTDQGARYTAEVSTTSILDQDQTRLSMDGRGRATENACIESLWRTVKYECIYLHNHKDGLALSRGLDANFNYYNWTRDFSALGPGLPH